MFREEYGGWQYKVYPRGDQVEKRPKSTFEIAETIVRSDLTHLGRPRNLLSKIKRTKRRREQALENLKSHQVDHSLLANVRLDGQRIIQDRATPVRAALENKDADARKSILDRCIACLFECWKQGFGEDSYSFAENYGISNDEIVVIDIGELCFSKKQIQNDITEEAWLDSYTYQLLAPKDKAYFRSTMARQVTVERLDEMWNIENRASPSSVENVD